MPISTQEDLEELAKCNYEASVLGKEGAALWSELREDERLQWRKFLQLTQEDLSNDNLRRTKEDH